MMDIRNFTLQRLAALACGAALLALLSACAGTPSRSDEAVRLARSLEQLTGDPDLGNLAPRYTSRAREAILELAAESHGPTSEALLYVAERSVDAAWAATQAVEMEQLYTELERENNQLELAVARRNAERARAELERQHLQAAIQQEEAERLAREAEAARSDGEQAHLAAEAARAEAAQARRMAQAQRRAAELAKKEAELAASLREDADESAPQPRKDD